MSITTRYTATSLADLAQHFEERAAEMRGHAERAALKRARFRYLGEASAWEDAARIVRNTVLRDTTIEEKHMGTQQAWEESGR